ncbi:MAG: hypothetical protein EXR15_05970 [Chitinophagaceae bacterium]|nr:hypothetical protein [Chitinophagaceae bacterium]
MKTFLKHTAYFLLQLIAIATHAQSKVVVEQIQSYSMVSPTANYWHLPNDIKPLIEALDSGLFKEINLIRDKNYKTTTLQLTKQNQVGKITIDWSRSANTNFHAYIEIYEMSPEFVFQNKLAEIPRSKFDSISSVWYISCNIYNQRRESVFKKTILLSMMPTKSIGMGYAIDLPASTPNFIFKAIQKGISFVSPNMDDMEYIEAKVPAAYATDNFWMPFLHKQNRIQFDTSKPFISYNNDNGLQLLRTPPAQMNKINQKDKSINNPYFDMLPLIKKRLGSTTNEYYHVLQPLRDVNRDLDYSIVAYLELNLSPNDSEASKSPILFLPGNMHTLFLDQDSIGSFSVEETVVEKDKFFNLNEIFNGFDSTKKYNIGTFYEKKKIISAKSIEGKFKTHSFKILINYANNLKTIFIDDKMVMVAEGQNKPFQMFTADAAADAEIKNFLLQMSFSEIFQMPS